MAMAGKSTSICFKNIDLGRLGDPFWVTNWHRYYDFGDQIGFVDWHKVHAFILEDRGRHVTIGYGYMFGNRSRELSSSRSRTVINDLELTWQDFVDKTVVVDGAKLICVSHKTYYAMHIVYDKWPDQNPLFVCSGLAEKVELNLAEFVSGNVKLQGPWRIKDRE